MKTIKHSFLMVLLLFSSNALLAQVTAVRTVTACNGKDTLIGTTTWAYTVGEAVVESYTPGSLILTQGFHQPDGYSIIPTQPVVQSFTIYPNPAKANSTLRFYLKADNATMYISIYDMAGKVYQKQTLQSFAGQTWHNLRPQVMAAGMYTVTLSVNGEFYATKFIIFN